MCVCMCVCIYCYGGGSTSFLDIFVFVYVALYKRLHPLQENGSVNDTIFNPFQSGPFDPSLSRLFLLDTTSVLQFSSL